jgi:hypothetical protein
MHLQLDRMDIGRGFSRLVSFPWAHKCLFVAAHIQRYPDPGERERRDKAFSSEAGSSVASRNGRPPGGTHPPTI